MNSGAIISFPIDPAIKQRAKENIEKQGFSFDYFISALMVELLKNFADKKASSTEEILIQLEKPSTSLLHAMKIERTDRKKGIGSPIFTDDETLIKKDPHKYMHSSKIQKWLDEQGV
jgi:hypothetical protein